MPLKKSFEEIFTTSTTILGIISVLVVVYKFIVDREALIKGIREVFIENLSATVFLLILSILLFLLIRFLTKEKTNDPWAKKKKKSPLIITSACLALSIIWLILPLRNKEFGIMHCQLESNNRDFSDQLRFEVRKAAQDDNSISKFHVEKNPLPYSLNSDYEDLKKQFTEKYNKGVFYNGIYIAANKRLQFFIYWIGERTKNCKNGSATNKVMFSDTLTQCSFETTNDLVLLSNFIIGFIKVQDCKTTPGSKKYFNKVIKRLEELDLDTVLTDLYFKTQRYLSAPSGVDTVLQIGTHYAGGIIFDLDSSGRHGYVCWNQDHTGLLNWDAAKSISSSHLEGYSDWTLPTMHQLNKMYRWRNKIQGFSTYCNGNNFRDCTYWSSEVRVKDSIWVLDFSSNGDYHNYTKESVACLRLVRKF